MKLWSDAWTNGDRLPARFAAAVPDGHGGAREGENLNPPLAWADVPAAAGSLVLVVQDFDAPIDPSARDPEGELPAAAERQPFTHWLLADLPPRASSIAEGEFSRGLTPHGKPGPAGPRGTRQGLNDYTALWAADPARAGRHHGYDGPAPPPHDALVHHLVFTLYAVVPARLALPEAFTGADVMAALAGQVLAAATYSGTCTLNPRLLEAAF
jgi:Raf kinase inhibitor-like YbhB/YbcL family protein